MLRKLALALLCMTLATAVAYAATTTIDLTAAGATNCGFTGQGTLNCTTAGSTAASGGNFIVQQIAPQSTGTGVIDSFLRVQSTTTEQGYNTSNGTPYDDKAGNFTRALTLAEVPTVTINGVSYRQFLLDINQTTPGSLLSLNQIQIFQANSDPACPNPATTCGTSVGALTFPVLSGLGGASQVFLMSAGNGSTAFDIQLNYNLNPGSGAGDMFLYVRDSDFNPAMSNVILYTQFGVPPGTNTTSDGFEEWAVLKSPTQPCLGCEVPEPSSLLLLGTGLVGLGGLIRRKIGK